MELLLWKKQLRINEEEIFFEKNKYAFWEYIGRNNNPSYRFDSKKKHN